MAAQIPDTALLTASGATPLPSLVSSRRLRSQGVARALKLWVPAGFLIALFASYSRLLRADIVE